MTSLLAIAFKEWSAICAGLEQGKQTLLLRKGGIAEATDEFQVEHHEFWLYPTFMHQQATGLKPQWQALLPTVPPTPQTVCLSHFCRVVRTDYVEELAPLLALGDLHGWSETTVRQRYNYRRPGLFVLTVRVYQAQAPTTLLEDAAYLGCKSWVPLRERLSTEGAEPVLDEESWRRLCPFGRLT